MQKMRIGVGVIGLGAIAERAHLPAFAELREACLVALSSARPAARRRLGEQYEVAHRFDDAHALFACEAVQAVAICTPNDEHFALARAALLADKHVLLEKPITLRVQEAKQLVALARRRGLVLHVHHNLRYQPAAMLGRSVLAEGRIGELVSFDAMLCHRGPRAWARHAKWFFDARRVGGGVLLDLGVHVFDLLRYFTADEGAWLAASTLRAASKQDGVGEHHAQCLLRLASGAEGNVQVSWRDVAYRNRYRFLGTRAALDIDLALGSVTLEANGQRRTLPLKAPKARPATAQRAFLAAIQGDERGAADAARGEDGAQALWLSLAAKGAAHSSRATRFRPLSFAT